MSTRPSLPCACLLLLLLLLLAPLSAQAPAGFDAAVAALRSGQALSAYERFAALLAADPAPPFALRANTALAALAAQRGSDAAAAVAPCLQAGDAAERAFGLAVTAHAAALRAERSALAAALPDAEPMAWQQAVQAAEAAVTGFEQALALRSEWPEVQRNLARARQRLAWLKQQRDAARSPDKKAEPRPAPPPAGKTDGPEQTAPELDLAPLSAEARAEVRRKLLAKQRQKVLLRQQPNASAGGGERDW